MWEIKIKNNFVRKKISGVLSEYMYSFNTIEWVSDLLEVYEN